MRGSRLKPAKGSAEWWPRLLVTAAVAWNLWSLRASTLPVAYLDDSSVHEQMVRFATTRFQSGDLPLTSWFPFLGLGSPQFLHYQSLPAMLTGLLGLVVGPDVAFRWTLYLLLSLWPVSIFLAARLFGAGRPSAAASALMSPFLVSVTGIGYEQHAYLWTGFGVWTQLWASLTLPLAWGLSWQAVRDGRHMFKAVALVSLTVDLHFETGYLALIALALWPLVAGPPLMTRMRRATILLGGSLLAAAWVIVPVIAERDWTATNEILHGTPLSDGYGAPRVLGWLASGQLLDHGRLPILTLLAAIGLVLACARSKSDTDARALLVLLGAGLLLSFGPATFGVLVHVIPGNRDIFFRRFMMGVQLAAVLLAGSGAAWCAARLREAFDRLTARGSPRWAPGSNRNQLARATFGTAVAALVLAPAWLQLGRYDRNNRTAITAQRRADVAQGAQLERLIALIHADGGGRVYAGMPTNWGIDFTVGAVPVFKYLESRDLDEVGYTLRTASLMTDPEYFFDDRNPSDYALFGIRYLLLPSGYRPPIPAQLTRRAGQYSLWTLRAGGYVHIGRIVGRLTANRTNIGTRSAALLDSPLAQDGDYLRVEFGRPGNAPQPSPQQHPQAAGAVIAETDHPDQGEFAVTVHMRHPGVVVLSASFDPGWTATIDGRPHPTQMVAPALVATTVPAGTHKILFRYHGFHDYPLLIALAGLALIAPSALATIRPVGSRARRTLSFKAPASVPGVEFSRELRNDVLAGDITLSVRLWKRLRVKQGGRYRVGPGEIEIDAIELVPFAAITEEDVRRAGEPDRETLRQRAAHAGPIDDDTRVYRIEFHAVSQ